jgi:hypothetical protein
MLNEFLENTNEHLNEIMRTTQDMKDKFNKNIDPENKSN